MEVYLFNVISPYIAQAGGSIKLHPLSRNFGIIELLAIRTFSKKAL